MPGHSFGRDLTSPTGTAKSKNQIFQYFFISFHISTYKFIPFRKISVFRPNAQVHLTKGGRLFCPPVADFETL